MNYRYNLDDGQAKHWAGLKIGEEMVIVVPIEQPEEDEVIWLCEDEIRYCVKVKCADNKYIDKIARTSMLPYPLGARVGMRETWRYRCFTDDGDAVVERRDGSFTVLSEQDYQDLWIEWSDLCRTKGIPMDEDGYYQFSEEHPNPSAWRSAQCMPKELWRYGTVVNVWVVKMWDVPYKEGMFGGSQSVWFDHRYPGSWERNDWCEIITVRKEE